MTPEANQQLQLLLLIAGIVAAINLLLFGIWAWRRLRGGRPTFARLWSVADLWFGVQLVLIALVVLLFPLMGIYAFAVPGGGKDLTSMNLASPRFLLGFVLPSTILQNVAFFGVPAAFVYLKYNLPLRAIGLRPLPTRRDVAAGLLLGVGAMVTAGLIEAGVTAIASHFTSVPWVRTAIATDKNNPVADMTRALPHLGIGGVLLSVLTIGVSAPFGEEMLFRGFAFNALRRRFGLVAGLIVSALLFTLPHSYGLGLIPVFALGLFLAWTYRNSGSLWIPIIIHITNNTTQVLLAFYFPQLTQ